MAFNDYKGVCPGQGDIGWIAVDPRFRGQGLGYSVSAAATNKLIEAGYTKISLYTEDFRLPAIKTYLRIGFVPVLYLDEMESRWQRVFDSLAIGFDKSACLPFL